MGLFSRYYFNGFGRQLSRWQAMRRQIRTESLIAGLPANIRKDIGWPDTHRSRLSDRFE